MYIYCLCFVSPAAVPEQTNRVWKEVLSASYSSSTSGNWSWDASDQSVPSTPSPPLSNGASKNFLLSPQADDGAEDGPESTHFMFEDPIPRKRKVRRRKGIVITLTLTLTLTQELVDQSNAQADRRALQYFFASNSREKQNNCKLRVNLFHTLQWKQLQITVVFFQQL